MRIRFYDSRQVALEVGEELGWTACPSIEEVFRGSDCVSVHLSARDVNGHSNDGRLTGEILASLGAERPADSPRIFLNLARGFLHSTEDLLAAVASGAIRRAAVDVYPSEPRGKDDVWVNPYAAESRIVVSPHIGASTREAQPRIARRVADTVDHFSRWGRLRDCVFAPRSRLALMEDGPAGGAMLAVAHSTARGTKRAVDEAIYAAGASNLSSTHKDFGAYGMAYELALLDRPLDALQLAQLVTDAGVMLGDENAIRSIRQVVIG
jgi:D-3-phosphoglycerate dehydrogenase